MPVPQHKMPREGVCERKMNIIDWMNVTVVVQLLFLYISERLLMMSARHCFVKCVICLYVPKRLQSFVSCNQIHFT